MPAGVTQAMGTGTQPLMLGKVEAAPGILWAVECREEKTRNGIILPDVGDAQKVRVGLCVLVGPGEPQGTGEKPRFIKEGDYFVFGKYQSGGEPVLFNGVPVLQFRQGDISAKYHQPEAWMAETAGALLAQMRGEAPKLAAVA